MVRDVHPVMRHLVQVDRADQVARADQRLLDVPGQVAAIEEVELAEPEADRQAPGVVGGIDRQVGRGTRAARIREPPTWRAGMTLPPGGQDDALQTAAERERSRPALSARPLALRRPAR